MNRCALTDSHNRPITYLRVSITDRCNLRCVYCMPKEGIRLLPHSEILSYEEIERVIRAAAALGVRKVRITGGEPLVRNYAVPFIGKVVGIPEIKDVGLTTNGVLLGAHVEELWRAGLRRINISLDTLSETKFKSVTRWGELARVLDAMEACIERGFNPVKINVVAIKGLNDDEIAAFGRMSIEKPVWVRFIEHMPLESSFPGRFLRADEILKELSRIGALEEIPREHTAETARRFKFRGAAGEIGLISPISHKFCDACNRLRLNADGSLQSCLLGDELTDVKGPLRNGATTEELMSILKNAAMKKRREHSVGVSSQRKCGRAMHIVGG